MDFRPLGCSIWKCVSVSDILREQSNFVKVRQMLCRVFVALVIFGADHFQEKSASHAKSPWLSLMVASERTRPWDIQSGPGVPSPQGCRPVPVLDWALSEASPSSSSFPSNPTTHFPQNWSLLPKRLGTPGLDRQPQGWMDMNLCVVLESAGLCHTVSLGRKGVKLFWKNSRCL